MAKVENTRTKGDTLYWWIQKLPQKTITHLQSEVANSRTQKHKDKLDFILFLRKMKVWSREAEKEFMEDQEALKKLKYRATEWLRAFVALDGEWSNADIHQQIAEIRSMIHFGVYPDVMGLFPVVKRVLWERELYYPLREVLQMEVLAASKSLSAHELQEQMAEIVGQMERVGTIISSVEEMDRLRLKYIIPIKVRSEMDGVYPLDLAIEYRKELEGLNVPSDDVLRLKIQYHWHWFACLVRYLDERDLLLQHGWELVMAFSKAAWLSSEETEEYAGVLMRMVGYVAGRKDRLGVERLLLLMEQWMDGASNVQHLTVDKIIFACFFAGWELKDGAYSSRGLAMFLDHRQVVKNRMTKVAYAWVLYYAAVHSLWTGRYKECLDFVEDFDRSGMESKLDMRVNFRAFRVLSMFLQNPSQKNLGVTTKSAIYFLEGEESFRVAPLIVVRGIDKILGTFREGDSYFEEYSLVYSQLRLFKENPSNVRAVEYFDYEQFWRQQIGKLLGFDK